MKRENVPQARFPEIQEGVPVSQREVDEWIAHLKARGAACWVEDDVHEVEIIKWETVLRLMKALAGVMG